MKGNSGAVTLKTFFKSFFSPFPSEDSQVPQCIVSRYSSTLASIFSFYSWNKLWLILHSFFSLKRYLKLLFKNPAPVRRTFMFFEIHLFASVGTLFSITTSCLLNRRTFNFTSIFHFTASFHCVKVLLLVEYLLQYIQLFKKNLSNWRVSRNQG